VAGRVAALERQPPPHVDARPRERGVHGVLDVAARAVLLRVADERAAGLRDDVEIAGGVHDDLGEDRAAALLALEDHTADGAFVVDRGDDPGVQQHPHSLADQELVGRDLEPLRVDHRRAADGLAERGQALPPVRHLLRVGRAPQLRAGTSEGTLGQPVQQLGADAGDDRGAFPIGHPVDPDHQSARRQAAEVAVPLDEGHPLAESPCRDRCRRPGRTAADHEYVGLLMDGDLTGGLGDRGHGRRGGRGGVRPIWRAALGEQATAAADPGAEVTLWVAIALWLVHCSLI